MSCHCSDAPVFNALILLMGRGAISCDSSDFDWIRKLHGLLSELYRQEPNLLTGMMTTTEGDQSSKS